MTIQDTIAAYAEGWTLGDSEKILSAVSPDMVLDDPAPAVHVVGGDASGLQMTIYCWVANENFIVNNPEF